MNRQGPRSPEPWPVIRFVQLDRPSAEKADFAMMTMRSVATPADPNSAGRLFGKFSNQSVKIVTGARKVPDG